MAAPHRTGFPLAPAGRTGRGRWLALALLACAALARADDTELFLTQQGGSAESGRTNVLFIIDTSGSMDTLEQTQAPWDASATFTGCYRSDALYYGNTTTLPDCASTSWVPKAQNFCAASLPSLRTVGQYGGFLLGWNASRQRWEPLAPGVTDRPVECQADRGVHGNGTGGNLYAADGATGPWGADAATEPAWSSEYQVFDGNWLNWRTNPPTVQRSRLQIVQQQVNAVVDNLRDTNVGIMRFNIDNGGAVIQALRNVDTNRAAIEATVNGLTADGPTPLAETLYEAALYFLGGPVDFGNLDPVRSVAAARTGGSATSANYASPVTAACQRNYIVLLTDGDPNQDSDADSRIPNLPDFARTLGRSACDGSGDGHCLDDVAEYLFQHDLNASLPGIQNVVVNTIGFTTDSPLLAETARRGGGQYFLADDTASLSAVLTELVRGVTERAGSFTAPLVSANAYNRTQSSDDVFVAVFQPTGFAHWPGNLKKYRVLDGQLVGANGLPAVDASTGFFSATAQDFWATTPDGDRVTEGGAANRIPDPPVRNVYTNIAGGNLTAAGNRVTVSNATLTSALLGVAPGQRDDLINWARGLDVTDENQDGNTTDTRHAMGDPFHASPVAVTYGGTAQAPDSVVYTATNDGYLHAVDAGTGRELWAFIPKRLLPRLQELYVNAATPVHRYGLDGELSVFVRNDDGVPGISGAEQVILLFGMGRGGDAVFALDVTNRNAPRELWEIDSTTPGYETMGQTWSTPVVAQVDPGGGSRLVALFGGGYDNGQDNPGYRADQVGNAIFMADLLTGARVWSAGAPGHGHTLELPDMQNSIPAPLRVLDMNGDGLADRIYVGDTGGRLWRFDFQNGGATPFGQGGMLAQLGAAGLASPAPADVRRFYVTPDVVRTTVGRDVVLAVNIGSGFRGHPLDTTVQEAFFSVRDPAVASVIATDAYPAPATFDQLVDATSDAFAVVGPGAPGWVLPMIQGPGEKVLSAALTFEGAVLFTSYTPGTSTDPCLPPGGLNRLYVVSVLNASPLTNLDGQGSDKQLTVTDRFLELRESGIAPAPTLFFPGNGASAEVCVGPKCFETTGPNGLLPSTSRTHRWFWLQN